MVTAQEASVSERNLKMGESSRLQQRTSTAEHFGLPFRDVCQAKNAYTRTACLEVVFQFVRVCVRVHAACVRQTALFEVAGTGALTAWRAPAGYWPTDGAEGRVCSGNRGDYCGGVEVRGRIGCGRGVWPLLGRDLPGVSTGTV